MASKVRIQRILEASATPLSTREIVKQLTEDPANPASREVVNKLLYGDSTLFEAVKAAAGGAPTWRLKRSEPVLAGHYMISVAGFGVLYLIDSATTARALEGMLEAMSPNPGVNGAKTIASDGTEAGKVAVELALTLKFLGHARYKVAAPAVGEAVTTVAATSATAATTAAPVAATSATTASE